MQLQLHLYQFDSFLLFSLLKYEVSNANTVICSLLYLVYACACFLLQ